MFQDTIGNFFAFTVAATSLLLRRRAPIETIQFEGTSSDSQTRRPERPIVVAGIW